MAGLYAHASCPLPRSLRCIHELDKAKAALREAMPLVKAQETRYGLFAKGSDRLWAYGHGVNPSSYGRGQYWTVHSLYYWRRDEAIVEHAVRSVCYMNINDLAELYTGDGPTATQRMLIDIVQKAMHRIPVVHDLTDCLTMLSKPTFPESALSGFQVLVV